MTVIFHVSDVHFGTEDKAALAWFGAQVAEHRPDLVLVTGDLTAAARRSEFVAAGDWLTGLAAPVRIEPGNHDLPVFNPLLRMLRPYARLRRLIERFQTPAVLHGVGIVSLKTTARLQLRSNWSLGHVGRASIERSLADLAAVPTDHLRIVACHHPLVDVGTRTPGTTRGGSVALQRLAAAGAIAVLSGHTHDPFDITHDIDGRSIRLIGAGTLSERVRDSAPSYNRLTVQAGRLNNHAIEQS